MNTTFPHHTPLTPVLDSIERDRRTLAAFTENELLELANEVRQFLLYSVANTGGHFGAGLGSGGAHGGLTPRTEHAKRPSRLGRWPPDLPT